MNLDNVENSVLLDEIEKRFKQRDQKLYELKVVMGKMEEMNKKLLEAEANRSKFISIIRNEFNNPLASMITLSKQLINGKKNVDINLIGNSLYMDVLSLNFQIANIINVAEIEAGTLEKEILAINFDEIVEDIKDALQYLIKEKNITLKVNIEKKENIYQDRAKLYSILVNLISNAINFSPKDSVVELYIKDENENIKFIVKDYGEGISDKNQKMIFERFKQVKSKSDRPKMGQGLGMGLIKDFIEFLDGSYTINSKENSFTIFEFILPKESKDETMFMDDDLFFEDGEEF